MDFYNRKILCNYTLDDFYMDEFNRKSIKGCLYTMLKKLNIIIHGPSGAGKTAILNIIIKNYYGNHYYTNRFQRKQRPVYK